MTEEGWCFHVRKEFANHLYETMSETESVWLTTADLGFGLFNKIQEDFPNRFINTGASEATCSDICVGLSLSDKIPVMYSITPFLLYRCYETWRTYVDHENIKVILVGSGRNNDYSHDGFSHDATDDYKAMKHFKNIKSVWPISSEQANTFLDEAISGNQPWYINLTR